MTIHFLRSLFVLGAVAVVASACTSAPIEPVSVKPKPSKQELVEVSFSYLPGWDTDTHAAALKAFRVSCRSILKKPLDAALGEKHGSGGVAGRVREWRGVCEAAKQTRADDAAAKAFFERHFVPWLATDRGQPDGLFTGYYEAELRGSWTRTAAYPYPLYARPKDLVDINLGAFREGFKGTSLSGRLDGKRLVPYASRGDIDRGALSGRGLELLWLDDPVDAFFLHVQGSGRVRMSDGSVVRVGYAGKNGHAYASIGKVLIEKGAVSREAMSMQAIRQWISANPAEGSELLAANDSYVFFRVQKKGDGGPLGAMGVALTPGRSLAVDRRFVPLGVPLWMETTDPRRPGTPYRRLMVAQDTGGAIKGPVRGDVFWGFGKDAASAAGVMKERGRAYLLLPNGVRPKG